MDTLAHHFLLLALDDGTGLERTGALALNWFAFSGALLGELQLQDRVVAVGADAWVLARREPAPGVLGLAEARLRSQRPRTQRWCLARLYERATALRRVALEELVAGGALRREENRFLGMAVGVRWPTADGSVEVELVDHLRRWVDAVDPQSAPAREDLLIGLLRGAGLLDAVWSDEELAAVRAVIEERTRRVPLGRLVRDLATKGYDTSRFG